VLTLICGAINIYSGATYDKYQNNHN